LDLLDTPLHVHLVGGLLDRHAFHQLFVCLYMGLYQL
jgi:hypothetical protein